MRLTVIAVIGQTESGHPSEGTGNE